MRRSSIAAGRAHSPAPPVTSDHASSASTLATSGMTSSLSADRSLSHAHPDAVHGGIPHGHEHHYHHSSHQGHMYPPPAPPPPPLSAPPPHHSQPAAGPSSEGPPRLWPPPGLQNANGGVAAYPTPSPHSPYPSSGPGPMMHPSHQQQLATANHASPRPPPPASPSILPSGFASPLMSSNAPSYHPQLHHHHSAEVVAFLQTLDLLEYTNIFLQNGFDRLDSVADIQEEDFEVLGVKRGHRRIIQREIASMRGLQATAPLNISGRDSLTDDDAFGAPSVQQTNRNVFYLGDSGPPTMLASSSATQAQPNAASEPTKRRYRRHPKTDPYAPVKPVSAYVAFSHVVREELKGASFTEIAKTVGERWQAMPKEEKERLESRAAAEKEAYLVALAAYKRTPEYAAHQQYLADFKRKYPQTTVPDSPQFSKGSPLPSTPQQLPTPSSASIASSGRTSAARGVDDGGLRNEGSSGLHGKRAPTPGSYNGSEESVLKRQRTSFPFPPTYAPGHEPSDNSSSQDAGVAGNTTTDADHLRWTEQQAVQVLADAVAAVASAAAANPPTDEHDNSRPSGPSGNWYARG